MKSGGEKSNTACVSEQKNSFKMISASNPAINCQVVNMPPKNDGTKKKALRHIYLGDEIVVVCQMGAAVHAAVTAVAGIQVSLESLSLC